MPNYLFVYYGGMSEAPPPTPAQQKKTMDVWMGWFGKLGKTVVEIGAPTKPGKTVSKAGARATGKDGVAGYSIVKANSLGQAVNMAKSHPDIAQGMKIAVYEIMPM
ncbi:MAG: hypothetical protein A2147_09470 [Chloroflexi bacterium RBG_16_57_8]|nr:MAG: hypothetical protein A2147_09470 [Chloroflexi bacterium RBG_16_57_8]